MSFTPIPLVTLPAGSVVLRDARRKEQRKVDLVWFEIGCYPVTREEYTAVGSDNASLADATLPISKVSWWDGIRGNLGNIAWADEMTDGPRPVGLKQPNSFGLYDTVGNVWEWCWNYLDPAGYGHYRVFRGGGWADPPWSYRASVRRGSLPEHAIGDVGFRVARGVAATTASGDFQGWSPTDDQERAQTTGPLPVGWTPLARFS